MSNTPTITDPTTWALDREIVLVRVLDATREAVFAAWTDADAFCQWFGPDGFTCTVREMDVRPGGRACFDMASEPLVGCTRGADQGPCVAPCPCQVGDDPMLDLGVLPDDGTQVKTSDGCGAQIGA